MLVLEWMLQVTDNTDNKHNIIRININANEDVLLLGAPTFYPSSNLARRDSEKPSDIRPDLVDNKEQNKVQIENLKAAKTAKKQR